MLSGGVPGHIDPDPISDTIPDPDGDSVSHNDSFAVTAHGHAVAFRDSDPISDPVSAAVAITYSNFLGDTDGDSFNITNHPVSNSIPDTSGDADRYPNTDDDTHTDLRTDRGSGRIRYRIGRL